MAADADHTPKRHIDSDRQTVGHAAVRDALVGGDARQAAFHYGQVRRAVKDRIGVHHMVREF